MSEIVLTFTTDSPYAKWIVSLFLITMIALSFGCKDIAVEDLTAEDWRMDLRDLVKDLKRRHVDLFHSVSKDSFEQAVAELDRRIPSLNRPQILVGLAQLVALIGDGHTSFSPGDQRGMEFHYYPYRLYSFSDGIYVIAAPEQYAEVLGKRLVQIDNTSIEDAFSAVSTTIGVDNDMEYQYTVPSLLGRPEALHTLGIATGSDQAEFVFEDGVRSTFHAVTGKEYDGFKWMSASNLFGEQERPTLRLDHLFATPLTLERVKPGDYYWFTYLEEQQALYFQYNRCWDQKGRPSFKKVTKDLFQYMDNHPVERLIVDLRQNPGGEPKTATPLIDGLARRSEFGQEGRLFVLVGRRTFSAALTNAVHLRSRASARIVGEPPRGKPNNPSEGRDINLKRTRIRVTVSTQFLERDPALGNARYLPIDSEATYTFESYQEVHDPVMQAALNAEIIESITK